MGAFSTLGLFIALAGLLSALLAVIVLVPWLRVANKNNHEDNHLLELNISVFQERLTELQADKEAGIINEQLFNSQKTELERQLLQAKQVATPMRMPSKSSRLIVFIWLPVLAIMAYLLVSDRSSVFQLWQAQDRVGQVADDLMTGKIDTPPEWATENSIALLSAIQTNVHHHPQDPQRWMRLSELFLSLKADQQSLEALSRAYRLAPDDEKIAGTYAQVSFFQNGGRLNATARQILNKQLEKDPQHEGAMMFLAMDSVRTGDFNQAQAWIDRLKASIATKSGDHSQALAKLNELSADIRKKQQQALEGIKIDVTINSTLLPLVKTNDVLFIAIRNVEGGAPFAVKRLPASELTHGKINVILNNQDAMMPSHDLQTAKQNNIKLAVTARISSSGNAMPQTGDLTADPVVLANNQEQANIEINQRVP